MNLSLAALIAACAPLIHPTTMGALVAVESGAAPYALSVNYPQRLVRSGQDAPVFNAQPASAREAMGWTQKLVDQGYTVSVGLAQINIEHLTWLRSQGLVGSLSDLFDPCLNLRAAQAILLECWRQGGDARRQSAANHLNRTLSCFNAGDPVTGMRNGYVERVRSAARRAAQLQSVSRAPRLTAKAPARMS
jgi:type IV secretion system protein VirB1